MKRVEEVSFISIVLRTGIMVILIMMLTSAVVSAQPAGDAWNTFAKVKFETKYNDTLGEYLLYPDFTGEIKSWVGKEITIRGYYVPFAPDDNQYIIISKYPMSQCYFCGGGGPESIAEVYFTRNTKKFKVDDLITIKGKLKLNTDDFNHLNFIITDAILVKE